MFGCVSFAALIRGEIIEQLLALQRCQAEVAVARDAALAFVRGDGVVNGRGAAVVQIGRAGAESPERGGAHFAGVGGALRDAVAEGAHVVQEQVGEEPDGFAVEGGDGAGAG